MRTRIPRGVDPMPDEHRYRVAWGPPNAEELRNRKRRVYASAVNGPYRNELWGPFRALAWVLRQIAKLAGVQ